MRIILLELMKYSSVLNLSSSDNLQTSLRRLEESLKSMKDNSVKYKLIILYGNILASGTNIYFTRCLFQFTFKLMYYLSVIPIDIAGRISGILR